MPIHLFLHPNIYYCVYVKDQIKVHTQNKYTVAGGGAMLSVLMFMGEAV